MIGRLHGFLVDIVFVIQRCRLLVHGGSLDDYCRVLGYYTEVGKGGGQMWITLEKLSNHVGLPDQL